MSRKIIRHYADQFGTFLEEAVGRRLFGSNTTIPADGTAGFLPGAIWVDTDAAAGAQVYVNEGTVAACDFNPIAATTQLATGAGAAWTGGTGTVYKTGVQRVGALYRTTILIDLTGQDAIATDGDVIGRSTAAAHLGQITAAQNGTTIFGLLMECLEAPAGASTDIDLFKATVATAKLDDAMSGVTGQGVLITAGGAWTNGANKGATADVAANDYLYLANGAGANAGTYTAGKFAITLWGY